MNLSFRSWLLKNGHNPKLHRQKTPLAIKLFGIYLEELEV